MNWLCPKLKGKFKNESAKALALLKISPRTCFSICFLFPAGVIPEIMIAGVPNRLVEDYYKINFNKISDMDGVWKLEEYISVTNGDTARFKRDQYKIFQGGYFMFVQYFLDPVTKAPKKGFGFGDFKLENNDIIETNVFCSYPSVRGVPIRINLTKDSENSFTQTIVSDTNGSTSIERYTRMPKVSKSTSNP